MEYDEFLRHIGKAGLTVKAFAELVGMNRVSISNLSKKGGVPVHLAIIAALMGEMADKGLDFKPVLARIDIQPRPVKGIAAQGVFGGSKQTDMFVAAKSDVAKQAGQSLKSSP